MGRVVFFLNGASWTLGRIVSIPVWRIETVHIDVVIWALLYMRVEKIRGNYVQKEGGIFSRAKAFGHELHV